MNLKAVSLALLATLLIATAGLLAARADGEDENEVRGPITAVNTVDGTVTIAGLVFDVTEGTRFEIDDRCVTFAEFAAFVNANPGLRAEAEFLTLDAGPVVTEVEIKDEEEDEDDEDDEDDGDEDDESDSDDDEGDSDDDEDEALEVSGLLTAVDPGAGQTTVQPDGGGAPLVLTVTPDTEIEIEDADLTLEQIAALLGSNPNVRVEVEFDPVTLEATEIEVELELEDDDCVLTNVNARANSVSVRMAGPRRSRAVPVQLLPGSVITSADRVLRVRDLRRGDSVRVSSFTARRNRRIAPRLAVTHRR